MSLFWMSLSTIGSALRICFVLFNDGLGLLSLLGKMKDPFDIFSSTSSGTKNPYLFVLILPPASLTSDSEQEFACDL